MEFMEAVKKMEEGFKTRRPDWTGYLFLDIDGHIRHAGKKKKEEIYWLIDSLKTDWELDMDKEQNKEEITTARLESLMDCNASHLKRLYYLEEIIEGQHQAFKKIADSCAFEMEETRKSLATISKLMPKVDAKLSKLMDDVFKLEMKELVKHCREVMRKISPPVPTYGRAQIGNKVNGAEEKEMEEVREKIEKRKAEKTEKTDKKD